MPKKTGKYGPYSGRKAVNRSCPRGVPAIRLIRQNVESAVTKVKRAYGMWG